MSYLGYRVTWLYCMSLSAAAHSLIAVPVEPDALNAIMRLCLRLTRSWELAAMFADLGGIRLLLALTQVSFGSACITI